MADENQNPPPVVQNNAGEGGMGTGMIVGILVVLVVLVALAIFVLPRLRGGEPEPTVGVPDQVNVDLGGE